MKTGTVFTMEDLDKLEQHIEELKFEYCLTDITYNEVMDKIKLARIKAS